MEFYYHGTCDDILILSADGGLNKDNAREFVDRLKKLVDAGISKVVIDCTKLRYISSHGVGVLIGLHRRLAERGGRVKLANVQSRVVTLITLVRLDTVFQIYPDLTAAVASYADDV
jgi:anti-sigma B factor antagonist